jgi:predicted AlkP superfamily pyrophosphatase or phosphodiesterase
VITNLKENDQFVKLKQRNLVIVLVAVIVAGVAVWLFIHRRNRPLADLKPTLILISIDGFRADYFEKFPHPTLNALAAEGVRAQWMTPSFPSLTFPNHYTICTGLYPADHGIVANEFYDPEIGANFGMMKREEVQNGRWWGGEPIWVTAEKQGQRAAPVFFPGSEAEIEGTRPSFWKPYDDKVPDTDRVDALLSLIDLPLARRPSFLTLYFSDVDHAGHESSPDSPAVASAIGVVDSALDRLVRGLRARNIYEKVNLVIVSDHGMAPVKPTDVVILDDYFPAKDAEQIAWGQQITNIFPRPGAEKTLFDSITAAKLQHAQCYRKEDIPARFHYQQNRRIGAIVCMAAEGWRIFSRARRAEEQKKPNKPAPVIGAHGYDNELPSMRAIFICHGPACKRGVVVEPFPNVDVYDIMTSVLHLAPAKNDGDEKTARTVLQ